MGEIADMMLDGTLDFYTGEYIGRSKGFPRTIDKSLPWEQRAYNKKSGAYGGIINFCMQKGLTHSQANGIIKVYSREKFNVVIPKAKGGIGFKEKVLPLLIESANKMQENFSEFKSWFNSRKQ